MRKRLAIIIAIALGVGLFAFVWQSKGIAGLEEQRKILREQLLEARTSQASQADMPGPEGSRSMLGVDRAARSRRPTAAKLRSLWPDGVDVRDRTTASLVIPKVVKAVEHCGTPQLLEIATDLADRPNASDRFILKLLVIMVGEDDPGSALEFWDSHYESFYRRRICPRLFVI